MIIDIYQSNMFTYRQQLITQIVIHFNVLGKGDARKAFFYAYFETSEYITYEYFS